MSKGKAPAEKSRSSPRISGHVLAAICFCCLLWDPKAFLWATRRRWSGMAFGIRKGLAQPARPSEPIGGFGGARLRKVMLPRGHWLRLKDPTRPLDIPEVFKVLKPWLFEGPEHIGSIYGLCGARLCRGFILWMVATVQKPNHC